jgi:ABC-type branched-subunit amino acid transport system ATPase component
MKNFLEIKNLTKSFDGVLAIDDVSFSTVQGSITLIAGENGAGKTTLFNLITGLEKANKGQVFINGTDISSIDPLGRSRRGIVRLYQNPRIFKNLTVLDNLLVAAKNHNGDNFIKMILNPLLTKSFNLKFKKKALDILSRFDLQKMVEVNSGELSYGQQKLLSFCMIVMNCPQLILLDEPFSSLNPNMIGKTKEMILKMKELGITFLIIEHNLLESQNLCDQYIVMNEGQIIGNNNSDSKSIIK